MFDGFYNPALQWLVLGALAPIIIHLATRSRPKPTPFPALRFLLASHRRSSAKFKIKQLLLLLLRVLALAMFAYVVARPRAEGTAATVTRARTTVTAVILLDNSYSMAYEVEGVSRFDKARELALATVDTFELGESRGCLLLVNDGPQPVIADFEHAYDLDSLKEAIQNAKLSHRGTNCAAAVGEAVRMLKEVNGVRKSVFLFTDLTQPSWPTPVPAEAKAKDVTVFVIDVGVPETHNPAVLRIKAPTTAAPGNPFEVRALVDAQGAAGRQIELYVDGEKRSQKPANAHRVDDVQLVGSTRSPAPEHWGRIELTGSDAIESDNAQYFPFRSRPTPRVVVVNGSPSGVARRDELFFLRIALAPSGLGQAPPVELIELNPGELDAQKLPAADALILCNVGSLSTAGWTKLRHFVSTGHALIVFGGDKVQPGNYEPLARGETPLLPCGIGPAVSPPEPMHIEPGDLKHPILRQWRGGRNGNLAEPKFTRYHKLTLNKGAERVLGFRNDEPALVAGRYGSGRVLVFASTADVDWNDLPVTPPLYPVLLHESVSVLTAGREQRRDIRVGGAPAVRIPRPKTARRVTLKRLPDGAEHDVTARLDVHSGDLALEPVERPGVYRLGIDRTTGTGPDELFFAANLDTAESNVARLQGGDDAVKSLVPNTDVKIARKKDELLDQISRSESIAELTSHVAGIMLAVLLAEMYLSNHMRERTGTEGAESEPV
jgi:hypothetical protein